MPLPESDLQMRLAADATFLRRLSYHLAMTARVVLSETGTGATHGARANYARVTITNPAQAAATAAPMVVGGGNIIGTVTYDEPSNTVTTSVTDGAIFAQVGSFWNALAGIDTGN